MESANRECLPIDNFRMGDFRMGDFRMGDNTLLICPAGSNAVRRSRIVAMRTKCAFLLIAVATAVIVSVRSPEWADAQDNQRQGVWVDPSTGLMWAGKDNGRDVNWHKSVEYCRDSRLAGFPDWRLPTIAELEGIYDESANAPGLAGPGKGRIFTWHVKGNLFLTGEEWSTTQRLDDRGHPNGLVWYFDFNNGIQNDDDAGLFTGRFADYGRRALCVRRSAE